MSGSVNTQKWSLPADFSEPVKASEIVSQREKKSDQRVVGKSKMSESLLTAGLNSSERRERA